MSINYYDTVNLNNLQQKEEAFSLTHLLYKFGSKLSTLSNMYNGKNYTIIFNRSDTELHETPKTTFGYSLLQNIAAHAGRCLKEIAGYFNSKIKSRHLLAQELVKDAPNSELVKKYRASIINDANIKPSPVGEGSPGAGAECIVLGCCCFLIIAQLGLLIRQGRLFN